MTYNIYRISSVSRNICYIGSTKNNLCLRRALHNYHYRLYNNNKFHYLSSFDVIKEDDHKWDIIEKCETEEEMKTKEKEWINYYDNCINRYLNRRYKINK